jgi:hypothetical protein
MAYGKNFISKNMGGWLSFWNSPQLKYYFQVDNAYVVKKLKVLVCPLLHSNWNREVDYDHRCVCVCVCVCVCMWGVIIWWTLTLSLTHTITLTLILSLFRPHAHKHTHTPSFTHTAPHQAQWPTNRPGWT